eukprot:TRINITY_DN46264_c0_g1_i1.p1 TRINITY_DN46264_c0_g1~~TRINITY_DN46264_c0_g1_i1.p1  ORF type:complete len:448 (+),score=20.45 TRINITY_DN46264_c0_g1_i1:43-1386(+)
MPLTKRPRKKAGNNKVQSVKATANANGESVSSSSATGAEHWWDWSIFPSVKAWILYFFLSLFFVQFFLTDPYYNLSQYNFDPAWDLTVFLKEEDPAKAKDLLEVIPESLPQLQEIRLRKLLRRGLLTHANKTKPVHKEVIQAIYTLLMFPEAFPKDAQELKFKSILEALSTTAHPGFYSTAAAIGLDKIIRGMYKRGKTAAEKDFLSRAIRHMLRFVTDVAATPQPGSGAEDPISSAIANSTNAPEVLVADILAPALFDVELALLTPKRTRSAVQALKHPIKSVRSHALKWLIHHHAFEHVSSVLGDDEDMWDSLFQFYKHKPAHGFGKRSLQRLYDAYTANLDTPIPPSTISLTPPPLKDLQVNEPVWKEWFVYDLDQDGLVTAEEVFWVLVEVYSVRMNYGKWQLNSDALLPLVEGFVVEAETGVTIEQWPTFWQTLMSYAKKRI